MKYNPQSISGTNHRDVESLHPIVRPYAWAFINQAQEYVEKYYPQFKVKIISTLRTWKEQDDIYAQGRTKPGLKVTNAPGGKSNHNWGVAFDIGVFEGNTYNTKASQAVYDKLGPIGESLGLTWGGRWVSPVDKPHYQFTNGLSNRDFLKKVTIENLDDLLGYKQYNTMEELLKDKGLI